MLTDLKVLHMDRNDYYRGESTSLNLKQVSNFVCPAFRHEGSFKSVDEVPINRDPDVKGVGSQSGTPWRLVAAMLCLQVLCCCLLCCNFGDYNLDYVAATMLLFTML
ncbi:hypothetical protein Droror1_Dr00008468 [Drosera rotundifolia]